MPRRFVAIDFETADETPESACAVGLVVVEGDVIVRRVKELIAPENARFRFARLHGIDRQRVANEPGFGEVWARVEPHFKGASFLVAHNAAFDRRVLYACCARAGRSTPPLSFRCSLELARRAWALPSYSLPAVCEHLGIPLDHHDPLSDAEAAARIALAAEAMGIPLNPALKPRRSRQ